MHYKHTHSLFVTGLETGQTTNKVVLDLKCINAYTLAAN